MLSLIQLFVSDRVVVFASDVFVFLLLLRTPPELLTFIKGFILTIKLIILSSQAIFSI